MRIKMRSLAPGSTSETAESHGSPWHRKPDLTLRLLVIPSGRQDWEGVVWNFRAAP